MEKILNLLNVKLHATGKHRELTDKYKTLKTDEERVIFSLNVMFEYNIVPNATGMPKNAKESEKLREQGNRVFVKGVLNNITCIEALKLYTKSIAFAPYPSKQLALAYANRSAVLFQLGLHSECILDIDRALALDYPDDLRAKLYVRKTECLMILGDCSTEDILKETQYWLNKMSLNDTSREKLRAKLEVLHHKTAQTELHAQSTSKQVQTKKPSNESPLPTIASYNDEVPCASDAVAIQYNERYGRHVVATRHICPGEVIAVEKPYSLILVQENMQTHCSNCLRVCWANIPCNYCTYAMYCSEECRYIEWKRCHDVECAVFPVLIECECYNLDLFSIRLAILALREAGSMDKLRSMVKEVDECDDPRTKGFSKDGKLLSDRYSGIYSLVTNTEKRTVSDLYRRSMDTSFMLYFLATRTVMFGTTLPEDLTILAKNKDVTFFGGLIMRHQQTIPCNMHTFGEEQGLEHVKRGSAALSFHSLINHSCNPNIFRHPRPKHIILYALYPIRKGEQLLDNYGQHYAVMPRVTRKQKLLEQYYFTCDCIPCQENRLAVEALIGVYLKSNGIKGATKLLKWFNILPDIQIDNLLYSEPPNPIIGTGDINHHMPWADTIEIQFSYKFNNRAYLLQAFTHPSYTANAITECYQRLEFLGDAILDFLITCYIYDNCGDLSPGDLTDLRSALVNNITFACLAVRYGLHTALLAYAPKLHEAIDRFVRFQEERNYVVDDELLCVLLEEEDCSLAEYVDVPKALGDIFESLIGAIYLDSNKNLTKVWQVIYSLMHKEIEMFSKDIPKQPVRVIHENTDARPKFLEAKLIEDTGTIMVALKVTINGKEKIFHGFGTNKKQAKCAAAKQALKRLQKEK